MSEVVVIPGVEGKVVAVVGRAASLTGSGSGRAIDAADVVVRVNWTLPLNAPAADVGERTDVLYHCNGCIDQLAAAEAVGVMAVKVDAKFRRALARGSRKDHRKYRPNTGVVAIFDALRSGARLTSAYGFDFYRTGPVAPTAPWNGPKAVKWKHSPQEDRRLLRNLMLVDRRFRPDRAMRKALLS